MCIWLVQRQYCRQNVLVMPGWNILDSAGALARIAGKRLLLDHDHEPGLHPPVAWFFSDPDALSRHILEEVGPVLSTL
jgi:hypothetical protein